VATAALADAAMLRQTKTRLAHPRIEPDIAHELLRRGETADVANRRDEACGHDDVDAGDSQEALDGRIRRRLKVTDRHTAVDYAHVLKDLADVHFAHAKTIVLVQDNLSIHSKASLYEAFSAVEARRLVFEWHYTPKHGSSLDLAESELGVLTSRCLDRRIPDKQTLIDEIAAWEHDRNANHTKADWQFTAKNARIRLKHLYPSI